ncbi:MAG: FAD-dependent oxidoreductase [Steroidobacteraceae bacterium]
MALTRRQLLQCAALTGGVAATMRVAAALELMPGGTLPPPLQLSKARGQRHVLILGAGIAGLVSAFELQRAGYSVQVLESANRLGGRVLTVRGGDVIDEIGNRQVCQFDNDPNLYFNAGASRIPTVHSQILAYCKQLGVTLEPHINSNYAAWLQFDGFQDGKRMRQREFIADARGFISELAGRSLSAATLDAPLSEADRDRLRAFITQFGDLDKSLHYTGSPGRAGRLHGGGLFDHDGNKTPLTAAQLLSSDYWRTAMMFGEDEYQSAVLQPVGGMDMIIRGFAAQLPGRIELNSQVIAIRTSDRKVEVTYRKDGTTHTVSGDYCLDSVPGQLLAGVDSNFSAGMKKLLTVRPRGTLSKIALQMRERFWEREGVYGGISWTNRDIGQIQYPSHGFGQRKGVLIGGYYLAAGPATRFTTMSAEERIAAALAQGEGLHPGYAKYFENGCSVAWHRMNHMLGCTARETDEETLKMLRQPEGRHYLVGDQISAHAGWMEAAVLAAQNVLNRVEEREAAGAA